MKKKIIALFIIVTIFYVIIGALLLINIQLIEAPEILMDVEVSELSSEKAVLHAVISIDNPNGFDLIAKNIKLIISTPDGYEVSDTLIEGGKIQANHNKTFTKDISVAFNGRTPELLTTKVTGDVGVNILFIEKTIPLKMGVITSFENVLNELTAPSISVSASIDDITTEGVNLSADITMYNPNSFNIFVDNISTSLETDTGANVGSLEFIGGVIASKNYLDVLGSGQVLLEALNAKKLFINMTGAAGVKVAGFEKNIPFNVKASMAIPDLRELLLPKDKPTALSIKIDRSITLKGSVNNVELEVNNTFKVDLVLRDISCRMYTVVGDQQHLIGEKKIEGDMLAVAGKSTFSTVQIVLPFSKLLTLDRNPDWLLLSVSANITIKGLDPAVYLEIRGYQDLHVIR